MRLICPHCQSPCRLKDERLNSRAKRGKCPNCGNLFPLPPNDSKNNHARGKQQPPLKQAAKNNLHNPQPAHRLTEQTRRDKTPNQTRRTKKFPLSITITGVSLLFILLAVTLLNLKQSRPLSPKNRAVTLIHHQTAPRPHPTLKLSSATKNKVISLIKHHALVADAGINVNHQQFELALLVSGKTPVSYSERLGQQFAHYLKNELTPENKAKASFKISVYYPGGTRIEVTTNNHNMDEEIIVNYPDTGNSSKNQ